MKRILDDLNKEAIPFIKYCTDSEQTILGYLHEHFQIFCKEDERIDIFRGNSGSLLSDIKDAKICENEDVYICKNPLKTTVVSPEKRRKIKENNLSGSLHSTGLRPGSYDGYVISRNESNIMGLKNIVIDVDCHYDLSPEEAKMIKDNFIKNLEDIKEYFPMPTAINFTGRGFHFWFSIKEASVSLSFIYKLVCDELCNRIEKAIKECLILEAEYFNVDRAASKNIAGLIRMPGTKNSKSYFDVKLLEFNKIKYELNELKDLLGVKINKAKKIKKSYNKKTSVSLPKRRLKIIKDAVENNNRKVEEGNRHNYCFMFYNNLKQLVNENKAITGLYAFNNTFSKPLPECEIKAIIKSVNNVKFGYYKYTNKRFSEVLGLNETEILKYNLNKNKSTYKTKLKMLRQKRKSQRNKKILDIYATGSISECCKGAKVCENTARNVIKKNSDLLAVIKRRIALVRNRKVFNNFLHSKNIKKAAKAGKCCVNTAKKIVNIYDDLRQNIANMIDANTIDVDASFYDMIKNHHNVMYRHEYNVLETKIHNITGLDKEDINIAIAPYIRLA